MDRATVAGRRFLQEIALCNRYSASSLVLYAVHPGNTLMCGLKTHPLNRVYCKNRSVYGTLVVCI